MNLKTKEEMYQDYLEGIEFLENEVGRLNSEINKMKTEIGYKKERIEKLKETAEIYKPNLNFTINVNMNNDYSKEEIEKLAKTMKEKIQNTTSTWSKVSSPKDIVVNIHANEVVLPKSDDWINAINNQHI